MKKYLASINKRDIERHETKMREVLFTIIKKYRPLVNDCGCELVFGFEWRNNMKDQWSSDRLNFRNGYEYHLYCEIQRNNEVVQCSNSEDNESYDLSLVYSITEIHRHFFRLVVLMFNDTQELEDCLDEFLKKLKLLH